MNKLAENNSKRTMVHNSKKIFVAYLLAQICLTVFVEYMAITSGDSFLQFLGIVFIAYSLGLILCCALFIEALYGEVIKRVSAAIIYVKKTARQGLRHTPNSAFIAATRHCKKFCGHCYEYNNSKPIMADELHKEIINKLSEMGIAFIFYYGGEPASHPSICSYIRYAKSKGICVSMCTDLSASTPETLLGLLRAGTDILSFSVDSAKDDMSKRNLNTIKNNLRFLQSLRKEGWRFGLNCNVTVHKSNIREIPDIVRWVESCAETSFSIQPAQYPVPYPQTHKKASGLMLSKDDLPEIQKMIAWLMGRKYGKGVFPPGGYLEDFCKFFDGNHRWECGAQRDMLFIDCDGSLRVCSYFTEQDPPSPLIPLKLTFRDLSPDHWENTRSVIEKNWEYCNARCYTQAYYCSRYYDRHFLIGLWRYIHMYI